MKSPRRLLQFGYPLLPLLITAVLFTGCGPTLYAPHCPPRSMGLSCFAAASEYPGSPYADQLAHREVQNWLNDGFDPETAQEYLNAGFEDPDDARKWRASGLSLGDAATWHDSGVGASDASALESYGATSRAYSDELAREQERAEEPYVEINGKKPPVFTLSPDAAIPWLRNGFKLDEISSWVESEFTAEQAKEWRSAGFDIASADDWRKAGAGPSAAREFLHAGLSPSQISNVNSLIEAGYSRSKAIYYTKQGVSASQVKGFERSKAIVKRYCSDNVHRGVELVMSSPYATKGKCYFIILGRVIQWLSPTVGLVACLDGATLFVKFRSSPQASLIPQLLVKSLGAVSYENALHVRETIPVAVALSY